MSGTPLSRLLTDPLELEARTNHEIANRTRDQHLARTCSSHDSRSDMDVEPGDIGDFPLQFTRVHTTANSDARRTRFARDAFSTEDSGPRHVEQLEGPVSR